MFLCGVEAAEELFFPSLHVQVHWVCFTVILRSGDFRYLGLCWRFLCSSSNAGVVDAVLMNAFISEAQCLCFLPGYSTALAHLFA